MLDLIRLPAIFGILRPPQDLTIVSVSCVYLAQDQHPLVPETTTPGSCPCLPLLEARSFPTVLSDMPVKLDELEAALRNALSIQHLVRRQSERLRRSWGRRTLTRGFQ